MTYQHQYSQSDVNDFGEDFGFEDDELVNANVTESTTLVAAEHVSEDTNAIEEDSNSSSSSDEDDTIRTITQETLSGKFTAIFHLMNT